MLVHKGKLQWACMSYKIPSYSGNEQHVSVLEHV